MIARALLVILVGCGRVGFTPGGDVAPDVFEMDADVMNPPPSCASLPATCGAAGARSCCESPMVPGGTFLRAYDGIFWTDASYPAALSSFRLDRYSVTVGRFRAFVVQGGGTQTSPPATGAGARPGLPGSGWSAVWDTELEVDPPTLRADLATCTAFPTWTPTPGANENRPMNCIDWYEAFAFCAWDGGFLPTEVELNYAASGGDEQRYYPWSSPASSTIVDGTYASYQPGADCSGDNLPGCVAADLMEVGTKPAGDGRWGHGDLAGNVRNVTLDYYAPLTNPCTDCANLTVATTRALRGSSYSGPFNELRSGYRRGGNVNLRYDGVGVRCARPL